MRKYVRLFALAVLAGAAIGIGGIVFLSLENKIVGALMFTAGLYSICVHGLNLFTGKVGYAVEQPKSYIIDLVIIWVVIWPVHGWRPWGCLAVGLTAFPKRLRVCVRSKWMTVSSVCLSLVFSAVH